MVCPAFSILYPTVSPPFAEHFYKYRRLVGERLHKRWCNEVFLTAGGRDVPQNPIHPLYRYNRFISGSMHAKKSQIHA
jgi:hypothetical protein